MHDQDADFVFASISTGLLLTTLLWSFTPLPEMVIGGIVGQLIAFCLLLVVFCLAVMIIAAFIIDGRGK